MFFNKCKHLDRFWGTNMDRTGWLVLTIEKEIDKKLSWTELSEAFVTYI